MIRSMPTVQKYMTASPHTIRRDQPLSAAHTMMREHQIRHIPVLEGGRLLGIVSDRDLRFIESLRNVDPRQVTVEEAMTEEVFAVPPDARLDEVAAVMAARKYGSAVVMQQEKVVGIFTTVDALLALTDVLHERHG